MKTNFINCVIAGDSRLVLKTIAAESIDMVLTSPPYNFGMPYDSCDDNLSLDDYFHDLLEPVWIECGRVLKRGGRIAVVVQPLYSQHVPTHHRIARQLEDAGFSWRTEIVWDKANVHGNVSLGSIDRPSSPYIRSTMEFIEVLDKIDRKKEPDPELEAQLGKDAMADIKHDEYTAWTDARWNIPAPAKDMKKYGHPAVFPEEIPARLMKLFTYVGDVILDPFGGVGSTAVAAWKCCRRFVAVDISENYSKIAFRRVKNAASQRLLVPPPVAMPIPELVRWARIA